MTSQSQCGSLPVRFPSQCSAPGIAAQQTVRRRVNAAAQHIAMMTFERITPCETVITGEIERCFHGGYRVVDDRVLQRRAERMGAVLASIASA
jgi:hypothetical protein